MFDEQMYNKNTIL